MSQPTSGIVIPPRPLSLSPAEEHQKYFRCLLTNKKFTQIQFDNLPRDKQANFTLNICKLFGRDESVTFEKVVNLTLQQRDNFTDGILVLHQVIRSVTLSTYFVALPAVENSNNGIILSTTFPNSTQEEKENRSSFTFETIANLTLEQRNQLSNQHTIIRIQKGEITIQQVLHPAEKFCNIL